MRKLICYLKAIPFFIRSGVWCPHRYKEESKETGIVIATDNSFRISDNFLHSNKEIVYPKATIIRSKCVHCGNEDISWYNTEPFVIKTE